jgi:propionate CoA-transferase
VNVSKVGDMLTGCGGFINISQSAKKVVFCGTLTAKGLQVAAGEGRLTLVREGSVAKLVAQVDQITFSARNALAAQQEVLYVTERAVFALTPTGVMLTEIAPGVDLQRDVLDQMGFVPQIADPLPTMQPALFRESLGGGA